MLLGAIGCEKSTSSAPSTDPARPNAVRKLSLTKPGSQTVTQDKTDEMSISINRDRFEGPVDVKIDNLPKDVEVVTRDMTIPADKSSLTVTLKAGPNAPTVTDHESKVTARAKNEKDLPEVTETFKVTVKGK
jgi:hypothetical protein